MARLACDVNLAEEAQMEALVQAASPARSPSSRALGDEGSRWCSAAAASPAAAEAGSAAMVGLAAAAGLQSAFEVLQEARKAPPVPPLAVASAVPLGESSTRAFATGVWVDGEAKDLGSVGAEVVTEVTALKTVAAIGVRRGRAKANAPLPRATEAPKDSEISRRCTALSDQAQYRRTLKCSELAPAGAAVFSSAPDTRGMEKDASGIMSAAAAAQFEEEMLAFVKDNLDEAGVEMRTVDRRELKAGEFGDFCNTRGHGKFVEWVLEPLGWRVQAITNDGGEPLVPKPVMIMDWILRMVNGDKEVCPKGLRPEYRNGPWYKAVQGKLQGDRMTEEKAKACGHGSHADKPCVYTTIEQKLSAVAKWYDNVLQDTNIANPFRNKKIEKMKSTMAKHLGRGRRYVPLMMQKAFVEAVLQTVDLDDAEEVLIAAYLSKNLVKGTRANDEWRLDWRNVKEHAASGDGGHAGMCFDYGKSKNNMEQRERPNALHCTSTCKGTVERDPNGKLLFASFCPVHLLLHAKSLQARDMGLADASKLDDGPVWATRKWLEDVPAGSTLVVCDDESHAWRKAKPLVMVVTRAQEQAGIMYDGSLPFVINGKAYRPPCRGVYFEVPGTGYAVHAWASAAGVTHRIRMQLRTANRRSGSEVIPEETIQRLSSKSTRIAMATLLLRADVPAAEVVANGEWEDEAMMRTYVELLDPFVSKARNLTNVIFEAGVSSSQAERCNGNGTSTESIVSTLQELVKAVNAQRTDASAGVQAAVSEVHDMSDTMDDAGVVPQCQTCDGTVDEQQPVVAEPSSEVTSAVAGEAAVVPTNKRKRNSDRAEYKPCCEKYQGMHTLKRDRIETDDALCALLVEIANEKPAKATKALCTAGYHLTRKELMNYRERKQEATRTAALPQVDLSNVMSNAMQM